MIRGIGCDVVEVARVKEVIHRHGEKFAERILTENEWPLYEKRKALSADHAMAFIASRWAAKEAVSKALGSGFRSGITLKDVEIIHDELGCPKVNLYGKALARAFYVSQNQNFNMHLTLSNEQEYVNAVAVMESI